MNQSFSVPNLPGMVPDRRSWAYREKDGFKRSLSRPSTAVSRAASPSYERTDIFNTQTPVMQLPPSRPQTAMGRLPSMQSFSPMPTRPSTAGGLDSQMLRMPESQSQLLNTQMSRPSSSKLPRYVETDKQIGRFYGYFHEVRPWDKDGPLGESLIEPMICRQIVLHYYIYDDTIEIHEPKAVNSGLPQGGFFRRGKVNKKDGSPVSLTDLIPGNKLSILGQTLTITDADNFTRDYFKKELNIVLPPPLKTPPPMVVEMAAQYATGLGATLAHSSKAFNTRSTDYFVTKDGLDKTNMFLKYDGQVLRFLAVEVPSRSPPYFPALEAKLEEEGNAALAMSPHGFIASANVKSYAFSYYLASNQMDLIIQKSSQRNGGMNEPKTLLKKTAIPKNWRDVQSSGKKSIFYELSDFLCGNVIDIYGRYFLLVNADSFTIRSYATMGIQQVPVPMIVEEEEKVVQPIPVAGDGFLPIGSAEDTLATVYGMPKAAKNVQKIYRNTGRFIRCKANLLSDNPVDSSRLFLLTFFLEDDTLQVYEEIKRNSGIWGGNFLKRGRYNNDSPSEGGEGRVVLPTDIYLGNVLAVHGYDFQIIEMDNMSLTFCENYPDEFPMSDTFRILGMMMLKIVENQVNIRPIFQSIDRSRRGFIDQLAFISCLDNLQLVEDLNDQEILTLMRRFEDRTASGHGNKLIYYQEFCDFISHVYIQHQSSQANSLHLSGSRVSFTQRSLQQTLSSFPAFISLARSRTIQWRRVLRLELHTIDQYCTAAVLLEVFVKNGMKLPEEILEEVIKRYKVSEAVAEPILQELHRRHATEAAYHGLDAKVQPKHKHSSVKKKLVTSTAIAAKLHAMQSNQRKASTAAGGGLTARSIFRRSSTNTTAEIEEMRGEQRSQILIDYNAMCDDIYVCDWLGSV